MEKVTLNTRDGKYVLYKVKCVDGSLQTTDLMTLMVMADHGLVHPSELDKEGFPILPKE